MLLGTEVVKLVEVSVGEYVDVATPDGELVWIVDGNAEGCPDKSEVGCDVGGSVEMGAGVGFIVVANGALVGLVVTGGGDVTDGVGL